MTKRPATFTREWIDSQASMTSHIPVPSHSPRLARAFRNDHTSDHSAAFDRLTRAAQLESDYAEGKVKIAMVILTVSIIIFGITGLVGIHAING